MLVRIRWSLLTGKRQIGAIRSAVGALRKLIRDGIRQLDADAVRRLADELNLTSGKPRGTLLVQSLASDPWPETATALVDWVDLLEGDDPASRRQLKNPKDWNARLKPELVAAVEKLRRHRLSGVDIQGTMRLSTGTFVGSVLSDVGGFKVAVMGREGEWASDGSREDMEIRRDTIEIALGEELAIAMAVSQEIGDEAADFIRNNRLPISDLIVYTPEAGSSRTVIKSPAAGLGLAHSLSVALRHDTHAGPERLHLFQAGPLPLAVIVGHLWNRMPTTQLYDDLGPGRGYAATFSM